MKHFIFILKTIGISLPASVLLGYIMSFFKPALHAHIPLEMWMITTSIAACVCLIAGIIISSIFIAFKNKNLLYSILSTLGFVALTLFFL
ncbi:hypothetical protein [Bernardetia sp.]|uniref:hypothetical protein n=1 Tax=Bernardetia sp. TaxID=1937974 RepID=UPI0025BFF648|nr:hypothetical protein [Bernardetia sp.]